MAHSQFNETLDFNHPLVKGLAPEWASGWGQDGYGVWVEISVGQVKQRLRWIPPGQFMMGSPEREAGRWDDEGPQHPVIISQGYWLFDTPATQALWEAVMGNNPSEFKSPQRPVETVSWDDSNDFITKLNDMIPGLQLSLLTEAQWEYACRANTVTSTYNGELKIVGERNGPLLDEVAWYGGNSGVGFDLENGHDSSGWKEKQYDHSMAGTREVVLKRPNGWGLYDMLGNVWEWCQDGQRDYSLDHVLDPLGSAGASRVVRGGSWSRHARYLRAANRDALHPDYRYYYLGFRCARVQGQETG